MKQQTRHQIRARRAYDAVKQHEGQKHEKDYRSFALSFPALLHTCGLAQAIAFAESKKKHYEMVLKDVQTVMDVPDLAKQSRETEDLLTYMRLTREALAAATWVKRYTEALLTKDVKDNHAQTAP